MYPGTVICMVLIRSAICLQAEPDPTGGFLDSAALCLDLVTAAANTQATASIDVQDARQGTGSPSTLGVHTVAYIRKTRDEWDIEQQTGSADHRGGWELVNSENTRRDARASVREYRENQPELAVRSVKRRVRIEQPTAGA